MSYELLEFLAKAGEIMGRADVVFWLGTILAWLAVWYTVYQLYRLPFIKLIIAADIVFLILWGFQNRAYFIGFPEEAYSPGKAMVFLLAEMSARLLGFTLSFIGAAMGLSYLQQKKRDSQSGNAHLSSESMLSDESASENHV